MTRRNWTKDRSRQQMRDRGAEAVAGGDVPIGAPARRKPKAELRAEIANAMAAPITKILRCPCGHHGTVELPAWKLAKSRFKCSQCGRLIG